MFLSRWEQRLYDIRFVWIQNLIFEIQIIVQIQTLFFKIQRIIFEIQTLFFDF